MMYAFVGILFLGLAIFFYDKHFDRLKVICYYIAIVFLVLAAIEDGRRSSLGIWTLKSVLFLIHRLRRWKERTLMKIFHI